jgi:hypothetical protein
MHCIEYREVDGVEFFVNTQTRETGMSVSGLARLCGVSQQAVSKLLKVVTTKPPSKWLESLAGKGLTLTTKISSGHQKLRKATIVKSFACAAIIQHYAYLGSEIAQFSLAKFSAMGIEAWICETSGVRIEPQPSHVEPQQASTLDPSIQSIIDFVSPVLSAAGMEKHRVLVTITQAVAKQHPELKPTVDFLIRALPPQPAESQLLTPTEIGRLLNPQLSARKVNPILQRLGLQEALRDFKGRQTWAATEQAKEYGSVILEQRADGTPVQAIRWRRSVVPLVQAELDKEI